jgi:hypothetical protein
LETEVNQIFNRQVVRPSFYAVEKAKASVAASSVGSAGMSLSARWSPEVLHVSGVDC